MINELANTHPAITTLALLGAWLTLTVTGVTTWNTIKTIGHRRRLYIASKVCAAELEEIVRFAGEVQERATRPISPEILAEITVGWSKTHEDMGL